MPTKKFWECVPEVDYAEKDSWRSIGDKRFSAVRIRILVVQTIAGTTRPGPAIEEQNIPANAAFTLRVKRRRVRSQTDAVSEAIRTASTRRITDKLSSKLSSELSSKVPGFSGKITSELVTESEFEISQELERTVTSTRSSTIEDSDEIEKELTLEASPVSRMAQLRLRYWPHRWDVYLHSYEYLELSYRRTWIWKQVRETIKRTASGPIGLPLASLTFYQPQDNVDVSLGPDPDRLDEPDSVSVAPGTVLMPASAPPALDDLEELAKLAFPATKPEKAKAQKLKDDRERVSSFGFGSSAKRHRPRRKLAAKKGAKKAARKFVKKSAKKSVRMGAPKKAAVKRAAKKSPRKRSAKRVAR